MKEIKSIDTGIQMVLEDESVQDDFNDTEFDDQILRTKIEDAENMISLEGEITLLIFMFCTCIVLKCINSSLFF